MQVSPVKEVDRTDDESTGLPTVKRTESPVTRKVYIRIVSNIRLWTSSGRIYGWLGRWRPDIQNLPDIRTVYITIKGG